jgi:signal transduction histidine kinase
MRSTALQLLEFRSAMTRSTFRVLLRAGFIMAAVAVVLLTASYILFWRAYAGQARLTRSLTTRKDELEDAVRARTAELRALADELEKRVEQRTAELSRANGDLRLEVAERRRIEEALLEADRRKDEFLAMLGHELRNPLTPIRCALQVLQAPQTDAGGQEKATGILERQVNQLVRIVDDLMDVSRITLGKVSLELATVPVADVVEGAVEATRPLLAERGHQVEIAIPERSLLVRADSARLEQVLQNLLTNAAKYTDPGGRIDVTVVGQNSDVHIRVRDNGLGIAPEQLLRIFDPYTQIDQTRDHADGGIGMGLTVVRRLVEMHGGSVSVASDGRGKGSEFTVRLPAIHTT